MESWTRDLSGWLSGNASPMDLRDCGSFLCHHKFTGGVEDLIFSLAVVYTSGPKIKIPVFFIGE